MASFGSAADRSVEVALRELPKAIVLDEPVARGVDATTCHGYWFTHGYVCDLEKLKEFHEEDAGRLHSITESFLSLVDRYQALHPAALVLVNKLSKMHKGIFTTDKQLIRNITEKCWNHMGKLRSNSLCSVCAANNFEFFHKKRAGMLLDTCQDTLAHCVVHFTQIIDFNDLNAFLSNSLSRSAKKRPIKGLIGNGGLSLLKKAVKKTRNRVGHSKASFKWTKYFRDYVRFKREMAKPKRKRNVSKKFDLASALLCENIVSLTSKPLLEKINFHLNASLTNLETELADLVAYQKELQEMETAKAQQSSPAARSLLSSNWRSLNQAETPAFSVDDFTGADVLVLKASEGSSFVALDKHHPNIHIQPMNFSLVFP